MWFITIEDESGDELFKEHTCDMVDVISCTEHVEKLNLLAESDGCGCPLILHATKARIWNGRECVDTMLIDDRNYTSVLITITGDDGEVLDCIQVFDDVNLEHLLSRNIVERISYSYPILRDS